MSTNSTRGTSNNGDIPKIKWEKVEDSYTQAFTYRDVAEHPKFKQFSQTGTSKSILERGFQSNSTFGVEKDISESKAIKLENDRRSVCICKIDAALLKP